MRRFVEFESCVQLRRTHANVADNAPTNFENANDNEIKDIWNANTKSEKKSLADRNSVSKTKQM